MIKQKYTFLLLALSSFYVSPCLASLTSWTDVDPNPVYSAFNSNMPPRSHFHALHKAHLKQERPDNRRRVFGFSISPYLQRSITARDCDGLVYGQTNADNPVQDAMGNFRGSASLLGLFLGNNPNGQNVWDPANPVNLRANLNGLWPANLDTAFRATRALTSNGLSIFSSQVAEANTSYFGAFIMPTTYQKMGFRFAFDFDFLPEAGISIQGGVANIKHAPGKLAGLSDTQNHNNTITNLAGGGDEATLFSSNFDNNVKNLLASSDGINMQTGIYEEIQLEDVRFLSSIKHGYRLFAPKEHEDRYTNVILTPYFRAGLTVPLGAERNYNHLLVYQTVMMVTFQLVELLVLCLTLKTLLKLVVNLD